MLKTENMQFDTQGNFMSGNKPEQTVEAVLARANRPKKVVVTAGMPYANGPLHLGHLAGAHVPADICARFNKMLIGEKNVLFVAERTITDRPVKLPRSKRVSLY